MKALSPETVTAARAELGIPEDHIPNSVAIIMDGNGRWAISRGLPRIAGHKKGADSVLFSIAGVSEKRSPLPDDASPSSPALAGFISPMV